MTRKHYLWLGIVALTAFALIAVACGDDDGDGSGGGTLETVRDRGTLKCGVKETQRGFGFLKPDGSYSGSDVEFCRAVAAAVLGDAGAVEFVPASAADRFELLDSGEIDVLIRTTTWTSGRDTSLNGSFAQITFYDGQGILVRAESDFQALTDLQGATICVTGGTTTESNLEDRLSAANVAYTPLTFEGDPEILAAFSEGRCDAWTADKSNLAGQRAGYPEEDGGPDAVRILGVTLSKEPLGPVTRDGDTEWFDIVNWTVLGMIAAEELGVSSGNVAAQASNPSSIDIARLLGVGFDGADAFPFGDALGIDNTFMQNVLSQVGNYGEVYERTIAPLGLERAGTLNALWINGGLLYAPPIK